MKEFSNTLWCEYLKLRKSKVFWILLIFFLFVPIMMSLIMFVQKYPDLAAKLGLIGAKAQLIRFGSPSWNNYLGLLSMGIAAVGLIGFGFVHSWIFGREFNDHTLKDLLSLPISRGTIVIAKFTMAFIWCLALVLAYLVSGMVMGLCIGLEDQNSPELTVKLMNYGWICMLTFILSPPVAFLASYSRGYLLPMGFVILVLIIANFTGLVGLGAYFPWAIPGLITTTTQSHGLDPISIWIVIITGLIGIFATLAFWRLADHK